MIPLLHRGNVYKLNNQNLDDIVDILHGIGKTNNGLNSNYDLTNYLHGLDKEEIIKD